jgi:hypothetical protein
MDSSGNKPIEKKNNSWIKYSSLGIQMGLTIYLSSLLGKWLDKSYPSDFITYHKVLTLFAIFGITFSTIRQVIKMSKDEEEKK